MASWLLRSVDAASAKREVQEVPNDRKRTTLDIFELHFTMGQMTSNDIK